MNEIRLGQMTEYRLNKHKREEEEMFPKTYLSAFFMLLAFILVIPAIAFFILSFWGDER